MKKKLSSLLAVIMVALLCLTACNSTPPAASAPESAPPQDADVTEETAVPVDPITFVTSTSQKPGAATQLLQLKISEVNDEIGGGNFLFEHYDSATLFKSSAEPGALMDGEIDIGYIQLGYFADNGAKWASMFDIAYAFDSVEEMMDILSDENEVGQWVQQKLYEELHVWAISPFFLGTRNIWIRNDIDVNTPADVAGMKIRMPNSNSFLELGAALNTAPTPLDSSETYLAMQTGTVDAQENITSSSYANAMQEVSKTIVKTEHMITANMICVNGDVWDSMTPERQQLLTEIIKRAATENNEKVIADEEAILAECESLGIRIQEPDKEAFKENAINYYLSKPENIEIWDAEYFKLLTGIELELKN